MATLSHNLIARRFIVNKDTSAPKNARNAAQGKIGGYQDIVGHDCYSCGSEWAEDYCPQSHRGCLHHCNHMVTSDKCDWCGLIDEGEDE